jgi:hypothetical protein
VSKSEFLIAFTWGEDSFVPKDGGTLHTWKNCKSSSKIHIPLSRLIISETEKQKSSETTSGTDNLFKKRRVEEVESKHN